MGVAMLHGLHAEQDIVVTQMQTDCLFEFFQFRFLQRAASNITIYLKSISDLCLYISIRFGRLKFV